MVKGFNRGVTGFDLYFERSHRLLCGEWMVGGECGSRKTVS